MKQPDTQRVHETAAPGGVHTFRLLHPSLGEMLKREGYTTPTPIQAEAIPVLIEGRDLIGSAQTGTGKTAAFLLPILHRMASQPRRAAPGRPRVVILTPTRELAAQIGDSAKTYRGSIRASFVIITGGVSQRPQVTMLKRGVDIVVATPGRMLDLMRQGHLDVSQTEMFVLDEVDRMLDMGFLPDIRSVMESLPERRQSMFFSATVDGPIEKLAREVTRDPVRISIAPEKPVIESVDQKLLFVGKHDKDALLLELMKRNELSKVIVFTQMKHMANRVTERLGKAGIAGAAIHGNKSQAQRTKALAGFAQGRVRVLVATDVAARGIDVDGITHVINYDLPIEAENYVHRIGRTGRAGASGSAISFCSAEDRNLLTAIEKRLKFPVPVDLDHAFHCETSRHARGAAPTSRGYGKKSGYRRQGGTRRFKRRRAA